jgi:transcriptional regulator with XRE-family HTH domain
MESTDPDRRNLIASRLDALFRGSEPRGRDEYSLRKVARAINEKAGEAVVSPSYLSLLRRGLRADPSYAKLAAVADFFGVPADYFLKDADTDTAEEPPAPDPGLARALQDSRIAAIALRSDGLSEESLKVILQVIENARKAEQVLEERDTSRPDVQYPS